MLFDLFVRKYIYIYHLKMLLLSNNPGSMFSKQDKNLNGTLFFSFPFFKNNFEYFTLKFSTTIYPVWINFIFIRFDEICTSRFNKLADHHQRPKWKTHVNSDNKRGHSSNFPACHGDKLRNNWRPTGWQIPISYFCHSYNHKRSTLSRLSETS